MFCITIVLLAGCATQPTGNVTKQNYKTINIGFIGPLTGDAAFIGIPIKQGVQLAAEEINKKSMNKVKMFYEDGKCNGKDAVKAFQKLSEINDIKAVIVTCSPELLAITDLAKEKNILVISPSATAPTITNAGPHVFRLAPSDALQGKEGAEIITKNGYDKIGILYINHDYGVGLNQVIKEALPNKNIVTESFEPGAKDFKTQLTKLKNVDVIYLVAFPKEGAMIFKQMKELAIDVDVIAAEGIKDSEILEYAVEKLIITVPSSQAGGYKVFAEKYKQRFKAEPQIYSGEAYDTMNVVGKAAKTKDIVKGMQQIRAYPGVAGFVTFDKYGDIKKPYTLFTVKNKQFVEI